MLWSQEGGCNPAGWLWHQDQGDRNRWTPRNSYGLCLCEMVGRYLHPVVNHHYFDLYKWLQMVNLVGIPWYIYPIFINSHILLYLFTCCNHCAGNGKSHCQTARFDSQKLKMSGHNGDTTIPSSHETTTILIVSHRLAHTAQGSHHWKPSKLLWEQNASFLQHFMSTLINNPLGPCAV